MIFNLWNLFFSLPNNGFVISTPSWKTAGELIHEFDHYQFLKEHSLIGKTEQELEEFNNNYRHQLEKRGHMRLKDFLKRCKNIVPSETSLYKIRVREWSSTGEPINCDASPIRLPRKNMIDSIEDAIRQISDVIGKIDSGEDYDKSSTENSMQINLKIKEVLSLPIELDPSRKDYPKVEIKI